MNKTYIYESDIPLTIERHLENYSKKEGHTDRHETMWHAWYQNKRWIGQLLQITLHSFPTYSKHDETHALSVLNNIEMILGQERIAELSATDCFVLLHTVYIHDIGMCITQQDRKDIVENENFIDMIDELQREGDDTTQNAIEVLKCTDYQCDNSETYTEQMRKLYRAKLDVYYAIIQLMASYRRGEHGDKAAERVYEWTKKPEKLKTGFSMAGVPLRIFLAIAGCAQIHTEGSFDEIKKLPGKDGGYASDYYHPRFIAVLLMLGDLLDMDNDRFHPMVLEFVEDFPETSKNHYDKHRAIKRLHISPSIIEIEADCENQNALRLVRKECEMLAEVLRNAGYIWSSICPEGFSGSLPSLGEVELYLNGKKIPEALVTAQFHISQKKAFSILEGSNLYEGRFVFLREFLQNAIDASKMQYWYDYIGTASYYYKENIERKSPDKMNEELSLDKYPIEISMKMHKKNSKGEIIEISEEDKRQIKTGTLKGYEYGVLVSVKDFGTGIDKECIAAISKVGNSRQKDRKNIQKMPKWLRPTAEFGVGLQSAFLLTGSFKCHTHTRSGECYEITFSSGSSSRYEGYINVIPVEKFETRNESFGTCFEVFVPLEKKMLHSESVSTWSGLDPFGSDYENIRPLRHAAEMIAQMALYLDNMLGELLFPVILQIEKQPALVLPLNRREENTIHKMIYPEGRNWKELYKKSWIYRKGETESEIFFGESQGITFGLEYHTAKLFLWNQDIDTFCAVSGAGLLEREAEFHKNGHCDAQRKGVAVYYKGIELQYECIEDEIELFEYIDIKGNLKRSHINISRRGFTEEGKQYFEKRIYKELLNSVKMVLKCINVHPEKETVCRRLTEDVCGKIEDLCNADFFAYKQKDQCYEKIKKLAIQITTVSFLAYLALKDVNDEMSQLGSRCGREEPCLWQGIMDDIRKKLYEKEYKKVRDELLRYSLFFGVEAYGLTENRYNVKKLMILDILKEGSHYGILQVRENEYAKWICYIISVEKDIYEKMEKIVLGKSEEDDGSGTIDPWFDEIFELKKNIGETLSNEHRHEHQFFLSWLVKNMPVLGVASQDENVRFNILSNYIYPCVYMNQKHKLLTLRRILKIAGEEKIHRFSTYAWQDRQYLAVEQMPFSCYFVKRGYLNNASLYKVIFPLDGNALKEIGEILDHTERLELIQNVRILGKQLDYKTYFAELFRKYNSEEHALRRNEHEFIKRLYRISEKSGQSVTSLILDIVEFLSDIFNSDRFGRENIKMDPFYFGKARLHEDQWHDCYIYAADVFFQMSDVNHDSKIVEEYLKKLQNLYNDEIMREIYAVRHYLRKAVKQEEEISVYLKMPELEKEYLKKCQGDGCLKEINKKIIEYILLNARYPIRREKLERCFLTYIKEIFLLLKLIEKEKVQNALKTILHDIENTKDDSI